MSSYGTAAVAIESFELREFENKALHRRDRLVSALLADRSVLRIICAPHGFGKTCLAYEYARRLFRGRRVTWVDASGPEFLHGLDAGRFTPAPPSELQPDLVVLDDLAYLDERRSAALAQHIDRMLLQGTEVLVTALPPNELLGALQPDRILLGAADLLVSEQECRASIAAGKREGASAYDTWTHGRATLFGTTPAAIWGSFTVAQQRGLEGMFDGSLETAVARSVLGMLLLGSGSYDDLARLGAAPTAEEEQLLLQSYPMLGIDPRLRSFSVPAFSFELLFQALYASHLAEVLVGASAQLPAQVVNLCLRRGETGRVGELVSNMFSDEQTAWWLLEGGWELVDRGEVALVESLLSRVPPVLLHELDELMSMRAWCRGMSGSSREAEHYAQRAMRGTPLGEGTDRAGLTAYLALRLFGGGPLVCAKRQFALGGIDTPMDLLAAVVDLCEDDEVGRALSAWRGVEGYRRTHCAPARSAAILALLTANEERFSASSEYRLAIHLMQYLDSPELRMQMQEVGCGMVAELRHCGMARYTEAALVADLWRNGFFGAGPQGAELRDARLLDAAAGLVEQLGIGVCGKAIEVPWESGAGAGQGSGGYQGRLQRNPQLAERCPELAVNLFGGVEVLLGGEQVPERKIGRKGLLLLIILMVEQGRDVSREFIFEELWPEADRTHALDNFYTAWSRLMDNFGSGPYLVRSEGFCRIDPRYVQSDVAEFDQLSRRLLSRQDNPAALLDVYARIEDLYRGDLVPAERRSPYVAQQRERYRSMLVDAMVAGTDQALSQRDMRVALWFARKGKEADPRREDVYAALMRAQVAAGQRCSAIRTYFECKEFLNAELGLDPSLEVQELYDRLIAVDPALLRLEPAAFG